MLSYSAFKNLELCPARYEMCNILYLIPKTADTRHFCLGSVGHSCLERWIKEGDLAPGYMRSIAPAEFDKYLRGNTVIPRHSRDIAEMRELAVPHADAIESAFIDHGLTKHTLTSEAKWFAPFPDRPEEACLVGVLDIYIETQGAIYDMKMSRSAAYMDEDQLCFYSLIGELSGRKITRAGFVVPLLEPQVVDITITPFHLKAMRDRIRAALEVIRVSAAAKDWEIRYNKQACTTCPVGAICAEKRAHPRSPAENHTGAGQNRETWSKAPDARLTKP